MQGAHVRVCRVHSWHKMMPSMLPGPLVRSKLALGDHSPPEPNLKMRFFLPCFVCVHVGGWVPCTHRTQARVGIAVSMSHSCWCSYRCCALWEDDETLGKMVSKSVSCIQFSLYRHLYGPSVFHARRVCGCGSRNFGHIAVLIYEVHFCVIWDFGTLGHERSAHRKPQVGKSKISRF